MNVIYRLTTVFLAAGLLTLMSGCTGEQKFTSTSAEAVEFYQHAVSDWNNFYMAEALSSLDSALQADSSFALAWGRRALVLSAMSRHDEAAQSMTRALALASTASQREQLYLSMWRNKLEFNNAGAAAAADSLLHFYPDEKEGYLFRGQLYEIQDKDFDAAMRFYQKAVDVDSTYAPAVMSLGYAYSALGMQKEAIPMMQRYIRLNPGAADPLASYADLLVRAGQYRDAIDQYEHSLRIKPDYWYAFLQLGNVKLMLGRLKEGEADYKRGIGLSVRGPGMKSLELTAEGYVALARRNREDAAAQFRHAIEEDSTNVNAVGGLVEALTGLKDISAAQAAIASMEKELRRRNLLHSTAMVGFHVMRARIFTAQQDYREALASCDSAMAYSVVLTRASVDRQIAEIQTARGAYDRALDACSDALDINPNSPRVLLTLTRIYHKMGDRTMTAEIGRRLLDLWRDADPDFADKKDLLLLLGTPHGV